MTSGLAKKNEMVTILTIRRMHSPWREQEVLGRQKLSRRLGEARVSRCGLPVTCHLGNSPVKETQTRFLEVSRKMRTNMTRDPEI